MSRFPTHRSGTEAPGDLGRAALRAHSTPEPDVPRDPQPTPQPDDVPAPANAPVQEPTLPEPPIRVAC